MGLETAQRLADEELMTLVGRGDAAAFEVFYDRHSTAAYSLAYRIVGSRSLAEDVVQDAFLSIWRSKAGYDRTRGSVRSWTLTVVRNRAIDAIRRVSSPAARLDSDDDGILAEQPGGDLTEPEALHRETVQEVRGALDALPDEQAQVINLAYFGGFTHPEIAETLGLPLGTVKGRMRLGLDKVRVALAEAFE